LNRSLGNQLRFWY